MAARGRELLAALCVCALPTGTAGAGAADADSAHTPPRLHLFFGTDATSRSLFGHQGFVWAPDGHLHEPGPRLRGLASGGAYTYETMGREVTGQALVAEIMPGFQWLEPNRGLTVHLGGSVGDHRTQPYDPGKPRQGTRAGVVALAESWIRIGEGVILDASAAYSSASRGYSSRLAVRFEPVAGLVLEPEIAAFGEPGYDQVRLGLFAELYRRDVLSVLAGAGWAVDRDGDGPYGGIRVKRWR